MPSSALAPSARRVLLVGGWLAFALIVLAILDVGGQAATWDAIQAMLATLTSLTVTVLGLRAAPDADRLLRRVAAAPVLLLVPAATVLYFALVAIGWRSTPSPLDAIFVLLALPTVALVREGARSGNPTDGRGVLVVDYGLAFFAAVALVIATFGERAVPAGASAITPLVYPLYFTALSLASLLAAIHRRSELALRGPYALAVGGALIGVAFLLVEPWRLFATGPAHPSGFVFSAAIIVLAFGAASMSTTVETRRARLRAIEALAAALPFAAVVVGFTLFIMHERQSLGVLEDAFHASVGGLLILAAARQGMVAQEAKRAARALTDANELTEAALAEREAAEVAARARADRLSAVVAASDELGSVESGRSRFEAALARILPPDGTGWLWQIDSGSDGWELVATHGPRSGPLDPRGMSMGAEIVTWQGAPDASHETPAEAAPAAANLACPLVRHDSLVGILQLHAPDGFAPDAVDLARLMANELAIAIENERLLEELRGRIDEMAHVQARLIQTARLTATGQLATAIAHEVNNPLTGVLGYSELLLAQMPPGHLMRDDLLVIRSEAIRASSRIRALLDFARPRPPDHAATNLAELVGRTLDLVRYDFERHGIAIAERHETMPPVELDSAAIEQVVMHILANARAAMPDGGSLAVGTRAEAEEAVVAIRDSGVGMDEATRARAFDPFFTTRDPSVGGGLGLSVSLRLVTEHGGSMALDSSPNQGTLVVVRLPLVASPVGGDKVAA